LKLFEYQAKNILKKYGINVPRGHVITNPDDIEDLVQEIGLPLVLKSQVLVAGRGKSGGILFAENAGEAGEHSQKLIGSKIKGSLVSSLLVEEKLDVTEQLYASVSVDRQTKKYVILASKSGGVDIEEIAKSSPENISRYWVNPVTGFSAAEATKMLASLGIDGDDGSALAAVIYTLYRVAIDYDAELVETNPLVKTSFGVLVAADARIIVDDNALFRHPEFHENSLHRVDDTTREAEARLLKLTYVDLDGDIGIIGNGAGLVMATIDMVQLFGGRPGNFLDMGGGAQTDIIKRGVIFVMAKPEVKAVLINIMGGITRCDVVASGIIAGLNEAKEKKPVVVRMMGTNDVEGTRILNQSGITTYPNMEEAVAEVLKK